jgi:hypothetical protein
MEEEIPEYIMVSRRHSNSMEREINIKSKEGYEVVGAPYSHDGGMHVLMKHMNTEKMTNMMSQMMASMPGGL